MRAPGVPGHAGFRAPGLPGFRAPALRRGASPELVAKRPGRRAEAGGPPRPSYEVVAPIPLLQSFLRGKIPSERNQA
jgi:hypothetical protein